MHGTWYLAAGGCALLLQAVMLALVLRGRHRVRRDWVEWCASPDLRFARRDELLRVLAERLRTTTAFLGLTSLRPLVIGLAPVIAAVGYLQGGADQPLPRADVAWAATVTVLLVVTQQLAQLRAHAAVADTLRRGEADAMATRGPTPVDATLQAFARQMYEATASFDSVLATFAAALSMLTQQADRLTSLTAHGATAVQQSTAGAAGLVTGAATELVETSHEFMKHLRASGEAVRRSGDTYAVQVRSFASEAAGVTQSLTLVLERLGVLTQSLDHTCRAVESREGVANRQAEAVLRSCGALANLIEAQLVPGMRQVHTEFVTASEVMGGSAHQAAGTLSAASAMLNQCSTAVAQTTYDAAALHATIHQLTESVSKVAGLVEGLESSKAASDAVPLWRKIVFWKDLPPSGSEPRVRRP